MSARFPDPAPQADGAGRPDPSEERELLALAEELRLSCPDPRVDAEAFAEGVRERLARPWTVWRTLETSRLARAAATLMVIVVGVAPLVAVARMLPWFRAERPPIGLILPRAAPEVSDLGEPELQPEQPAGDAAAEAGLAVVQDRMRRAARSWRGAGPAAPDAVPPPRIPLWNAATADELWQEFVRRCAAADAGPLPEDLAVRVQVLALDADRAAAAALAPWLWVLRGEILPLERAVPAYAWAGAPWLGGR